MSSDQPQLPEEPATPRERRQKREERRAGRRAERAKKAHELLHKDQPAEDLSRAPEVWRGYRLSSFQRRAIAAIERGGDVLVSAPTGAGKTLVAEYAMHAAIERGKRVVYTSPIKALSNQKYRDFRDVPGLDVGLMTGDVTIRPEAQVRIMTTEILRNAIFENPKLLHDVEYVIFDEVHYMDDFERGSVWEESLIFAPQSIRFVCLSATISNAEELGAWLREIRSREVSVILSSRRPVPLTHLHYTERSGIFELHEIDRVRKHELERAGRTGRGKDRHRGRQDGRHTRRGTGRELTEVPDPAPLFDHLGREGLLPALVFAFSRKDCERLALANAGRDLLSREEKRRLDALVDELIRVFQLTHAMAESPLFQLARRGVAYHHAGMLPIHKELVERMFTSGLIRLLFTTETFALGINMPARAVVFYSLRKFDGVSFDYMSTRDYMQMAGRAGRQGLDDTGLVFALLAPKDLAEAPLKRLIDGRPEPVESRFRLAYSSILHLVERLGRARMGEAWEKSFNRFQHRLVGRKQEEQNRRQQERVLESHLALLEELGYVRGEELTPRGRFAKLINGYELQVTELLFRGVLENLSPPALAVVFTAILYEDRKKQPAEVFVPAKYFSALRGSVTREIRALRSKAGEHLLMETIKPVDWGLTVPLMAWIEGADITALEERSDATPGDMVRTFRMSIQLMRQVRRAISKDWDLHEKLDEAVQLLNRDEVDARRQLELG